MKEYMNTKETLKTYFGYDSFREGQENIIDSIISGRDVLAIMPTGAGKSICYQVPALMLSGITLVISPLISLMQDQVKSLNEAGIHAAFINSALSEAQISKALSLARCGTYKIIYVAPERLESMEFIEFAKNVEISMVTIDEAHCISQWGQDFRPSYLKIIEFVKIFNKRPIISAFTATATSEVKNDILCILNLSNPNIVMTGFDRENLYYSVENTRKKDEFIVDYIDKHPSDSGIIYCSTRKNVDNLFEKLSNKGYAVTRYHAGIDNETRKKNQDEFIYDNKPIIIATNAFGMGIDKSNVRYVIHYNMPQSMENYYQEAGRAGRDGEPSKCILLFSAQDVIINKFLLENKDFSELELEDIELVKQRDIKRLRIMEGYCKTTTCLRNYILNYFGEKTTKNCDDCGNCHRQFNEIDMTNQAKKVINCVAEARGRYGLTVILGTLVGANRARLRELGMDKYRTYGALKEYNEPMIRMLIEQLILDEYLIQTNDKYSVLKVGNIEPLKDENTHVIMKTYENKEQESKKKTVYKRGTDILTAAGYELFEALRNLRMQIAREESMPPYIIFNDKTLLDMCVKLPTNDEEMLSVSGVGENKLKKYGQRFIECISNVKAYNIGAVFSIVDEKENSEEYLSIKEKSTRKKGGRKARFCITKEDADNFVYKDLYYASEIKDELNRICTVEGVKKATFDVVWEYLVEQGLTYIDETKEKPEKLPTDKGLACGIVIEDKIGRGNIPYKLIKYPPSVQKMVVEYFANLGKEDS